MSAPSTPIRPLVIDVLDDLIIDQMYVELEGELDCDDLNANVFPGKHGDL